MLIGGNYLPLSRTGNIFVEEANEINKKKHRINIPLSSVHAS